MECKESVNIISCRTKEQAEEWGYARIKEILKQDITSDKKIESIRCIVKTVCRHLDELEAEYGRAD